MGNIKICPKCGSPNISHDLSIMGMLAYPSKYICENCGFTGIAIEIDSGDYENFMKGLNK